MLHRGTANQSGQPRPFVVFTFGRSGARDVLNFPKRSLLIDREIEVEEEEEDKEKEKEKERGENV